MLPCIFSRTQSQNQRVNRTWTRLSHLPSEERMFNQWRVETCSAPRGLEVSPAPPAAQDPPSEHRDEGAAACMRPPCLEASACSPRGALRVILLQAG